MSFAVALLCHPVGTLTALVTGIVFALSAAQSRRFLPAFTAVSAGLLTILAFLQVPPSAAGLAWLAVGVALLHAEFFSATFGLAGVVGICAAAWGSFFPRQRLRKARRWGTRAFSGRAFSRTC